MYKASKYEVSPDMKHVLLAYNVAPVSFSFVCLFFELAAWQPDMSAASSEGLGGGTDSGCGKGRQKVMMAGCAGLSHTTACQRQAVFCLCGRYAGSQGPENWEFIICVHFWVKCPMTASALPAPWCTSKHLSSSYRKLKYINHVCLFTASESVPGSHAERRW